MKNFNRRLLNGTFFQQRFVPRNPTRIRTIVYGSPEAKNPLSFVDNGL